MSVHDKDTIITVNEKTYKKHVILADVNIPYKLTVDRVRNKLYFCINAEEFSDQSFQIVVLDLSSGAVRIVPSIRNGFASTFDSKTGTVYLGGSNGIFKYNHEINDIETPAVVSHVDVFDMCFQDYLYYVNTANLDLYVLRNNSKSLISTVEEYGIHHFVVNEDKNIIFANPSGLFTVAKDAKSPMRFNDNIQNVRGITLNLEGKPYLIAQNGIYLIDQENERTIKILSLTNGYGLAFDNNNNIVYSNERSVIKLIQID